jgi:hypothetical protein
MKQSQPIAMRADDGRILPVHSRRTEARSRLRKFPVIRGEDNKQMTGYVTEALTCSKHIPERSRPSMFQPRTAARYVFSHHPFSPENSVNDICLDSATIFANR